ncbi:MAG: mechanosensitive ion channel domain-containing protein [Sulfurovaceae bacterium]|nr:mechanosensitive ion channel [Sulfurovaceae bacterium]
MNAKIILFFILTFFLFGAPSQSNIEINESQKEELNTIKTKDLVGEKNNIDDELKNNIWITVYENYQNYQVLQNKKNTLDREITRLERKSPENSERQTNLKALQDEREGIVNKLQLLGEYEEEPFKKLLSPNQIDNAPIISNPLSIFSALSYREKLKSDQNEYEQRYKSLISVVENLERKEQILKELVDTSTDKQEYKQEIAKTKELLDTLRPFVELFRTTLNVYSKKIEEMKIGITQGIAQESKKLITVGIILGVLFGLLLFSKYLMRRYLTDIERFYTLNKALNVTFVIFVILILLFAYIENVNYLVTILGFASAGIAIALKEWFMSIIGWLVIFFGGSVHVGDRVRFFKDGAEYVGDIIDISLLRMTILEDVTLTTFERNRRAGRVVYIPNNYIFTNMIANYTHSGLDTVWDGIDFIVTFDSNINKASSIAKDIAQKYSKGYTENTRKKLNRLRRHHHLKNISVEPRVFTLITPYGMKISVWYYTNSYATLPLRSTISASIINSIKNEHDILLAYPSQSIFMANDNQKNTPPEDVQEHKESMQ